MQKKSLLTKIHTWQTSLAHAISDPKELFELLELDPRFLATAEKAARLFPLKIPRPFLSRIEKGNINDPLLRQFLPLDAETYSVPGYEKDPLEENRSNVIPGLLHKYQGRVLITLTGACAVNCRYCFRRHFPYENNNPGSAGWKKLLEYIQQDESISEVILSGGDPLVVSDTTLKNKINQLNDVLHIKRLRIHTRLPIVLPERITPELLHWLATLPLKTIMVVHCNHPNEINQEVKEVIQDLRKAGVTLFNQAVLLRKVNDDVDTLVALSEVLFETGIQPYYLHILDKVAGAAHFDLDLETAKSLHRGISQRLPGYLVPKLACEQAGAPAKLTLNSFQLYTG